jgi:anti-sigma B factor antagonist
MERASRLEVVTVEGQECVRLDLRGQLDVASVPVLMGPLLAAERAGPALVVLDVREVTLLDAAGLRVFLDAARRAHLHDRRFAIARPDYDTARVLRLTGLDHAIEVLDRLPPCGPA